MKVSVKSNHTMLRLSDMNPGVLFERKNTLYIKTDTRYAKDCVNCVNVVTGRVIPFDRDEVCQVRDDLHITNISDYQ